STSDAKSGIGAINQKAGSLTSQWQQGLVAFYASKPQYSQASSSFSSLASADPDFAGVQSWLNAAKQHTPSVNIPVPSSATPGSFVPPSQNNQGPGSSPSLAMLAVIVGGLLVVLLALAIGGYLLLTRQRAVAPSRYRARRPMLDERGLDLLPDDDTFPV